MNGSWPALRWRGHSALSAGRFVREADKLRLYRAIATMDRTAPLPPLRNQKPTWGKAAALMRNWQLNKVAERLDGLAAAM